MHLRSWSGGAFVAVSMLAGAGCSTSSSAPPLPAATVAPVPAVTAMAEARFTIVIPPVASATSAANAGARARERPSYVSPKTASIVITIAGTPQPAVDLAAPSPICTAGASGTTCTFSVMAPIGTEDFRADTYDAAGGAGHVLSTGSASSTIVSGDANAVTITLLGIPASILVANAPVPACKPTTAPLTITALDAAAQPISGTYAAPVSLVDTNTAHTSIAPATLTSSATTAVTLTYDGNSPGRSVITAKIGTTAIGSGLFAPVPTICAEYPIPGSELNGQFGTGPQPRGIVAAGTDLYATDFNTGTIAQVQSTVAAMPGTIVTYPLDSTVTSGKHASMPTDITLGPDGKLWVADYDDGIETLMPAAPAVQSSYSQDGLTMQGSEAPHSITVGPGGANASLYFTNSIANQIVRVTTAGVFSVFDVTSGSAVPEPEGIALGADGNIWYTEFLTNEIGVISPSGTILHEYPLKTAQSGPRFMTPGPDGAIWFSEYLAGQIGRIDTAGNVTEYPIEPQAKPYEIVTALDGDLYFCDGYTNLIGRITPQGVVTEYPTPTAGSGPFGIALGPDGNIWFTENAAGKVAYLAY